MIYVGDCFAIGLVLVLFLFFFEGKARPHYTSLSSKYFIAGLICTALTSAIDIASIVLMELEPMWIELHVLANSLYFVVNLVTTSFIGLFLFTKILEHSHDSHHCMKNAVRGLVAIFCVYILIVILNLWTGWLFSFNEEGKYIRGPLNAIGYLATICQMVLVIICYARNSKMASRSMKRVLLMTFPVVVMCIIIQRIYPAIMLNGFIMSMVDTVLFLSFQGQRQGIHSLTNLNDRHRFFKEIERRINAKERFCVHLINVKGFGAVNRKYGHMYGDELLYQFAFSLERLFKDTVAFHMNGTVFSLIMPSLSESDAEKRTGELLYFLDNGIWCMRQHVTLQYVDVEYAVDETEKSAADFYEKLEYAASRAYNEKLSYIRYTDDIGKDLIRSRYLTERLRHVDKAHGYEVWFQPVQCISTCRFCSMEALIRLREPDGSMISPGEFIPLAEETGCIAPITWFVVEEVCDVLRRRRELDSVSVSVNVPMAQLLDKGFITRLNSIVDRAGIAHNRICIEFTERAILDTFEQTQSVMESLKEDGYRFFLDDFGAGYSNFNCLLQLPFQLIKLDTCLVRPAREGSDTYSAARTLTKLFHEMGFEVIAEGAETMAEVEALKANGVDRVQGYALARPMPEDVLIDFYNK